MPKERSISFRAQLKANTQDLIREVGWNCAYTIDLIAELVSKLAAYTEEGVPMRPAVFICSSIAALVQRSGAGEFVPLSKVGVPTANSAAKILKAAAPLCYGNWNIYIERSDNGATMQFGVFCGSSDPSVLTVDRVVLEGYTPEFPLVRIAQTAINKVEVRTNAGDGVEFRFNDEQDVSALDDRQDIRKLAQAIAEKTAAPIDNFSQLLDRLLSDAIFNSHGTLIAVVPSGAPIPTELKDIIEINPPLNLFERLHNHVNEGRTATTVSRLQTAAELLSGFISSDGITVFSDSGLVLGYRAFVSSNDVITLSDGCARSRAFKTMKTLVGKGRLAAFFRSQDGRTELKI